jgi:hypothetical protein
VDILNATHPAYPSPASVRRHQDAHRIADAHHANNARIHAILSRALVDLDGCDLGGFSLVEGMDLSDVYDTIQVMLPDLDGNDAGEKLNEWAADRAGDVS